MSEVLGITFTYSLQMFCLCDFHICLQMFWNMRLPVKRNIGAHLQPAFMSEYALETAIDDLTCGYGVISTLPLYQVLGAQRQSIP
jgi:hypothetical protein